MTKRIPWNKGLTKETSEKVANLAQKMSEGSKGKIPWNKGKRGYKMPPRSEEHCRNISLSKMGEQNGMFGHVYSDKERQNQSETMKRRILEGSFTPKSSNRLCHHLLHWNHKNYRSTWEIAFHFLNPSYEYETLRISYTANDKDRIFIVDFVDHSKKILVEIKPKSIKADEKYKAAERWCLEKGYTFQVISEDYFIENMDILVDSELPSFVKDRLKKI